MFIRITNLYNPIQTLDVVGLKCTITDTIEPMKLELFQMDIDAEIFYRRTKKLTGVFYRSEDGQEIPTRLWSQEMQSFFLEAQKNAPIEPPFWEVTLAGKIYLAIILSGIVGLVSWLSYTVHQDAYIRSIQENIKKHIAQPMKVGDEYLAEVDPLTGSAQWIKILSIQGDAITVKFSKETLKMYNSYKSDSYEASMRMPHGENDYSPEVHTLSSMNPSAPRSHIFFVDTKTKNRITLADKYIP